VISNSSTARRVPILTYHQITPAPHPRYAKYAITPHDFAIQLQWIADNGFVPVRLEDLFGTARCDVPAKPIVLTFDDGFEDCLEHAVPVLQRHSFTATFFLVAGSVGRTSRWLLEERSLEYRLIDWPSARMLLKAGFECGAHGMNHRRLATLSTAECLHELMDARVRLEDNLNSPIRHLSYPFGSFNPAVRNMAAECGYVSACTVEPGIASTEDDPLTLKRLHVIAVDGALTFTRHLKSDRRRPFHMLTSARRICRTFVARK
jgi:peptidoglycan/xylan/chitin deacetylase (PgdA/CDA1 family)